MSQRLIDLNPDLSRLREDGYAVEIRSSHLLLHEVPYVNSKKEIKYGVLVSDLGSMAGDRTTSPVANHVAYFIGEHPCNSDGTQISAIRNSSQNQKLADNVEINHTFSAKPHTPYLDYYEKMTTYVKILSSQVQLIDNLVPVKPFKLIIDEGENSVFNYLDTNSSKSKIGAISAKLHGQKIAIVGLGGTGSYILDFVAKTPVDEIHLFDGDMYLQHNAFRSPGATSVDQLRAISYKTDHLRNVYSQLRRGIYSHNHYVDHSCVNMLSEMSFVFVCIDNGKAKKVIVDFLINRGLKFIDVGIGVLNVEGSLVGHVRTTTCAPEQNGHINSRIPFADAAAANDYSTNIQIAELNALNAAFAVVKWKKLLNFYQDLGKEFNTTYSINDGILINEDSIT